MGGWVGERRKGEGGRRGKGEGEGGRGGVVPLVERVSWWLAADEWTSKRGPTLARQGPTGTVG